MGHLRPGEHSEHATSMSVHTCYTLGSHLAQAPSGAPDSSTSSSSEDSSSLSSSSSASSPASYSSMKSSWMAKSPAEFGQRNAKPARQLAGVPRAVCITRAEAHLFEEERSSERSRPRLSWQHRAKPLACRESDPRLSCTKKL